MLEDRSPILASPRPYGAHVVRRRDRLQTTFRAVLLFFSAMHEEEGSDLLTFLVWLDPRGSDVRAVEPIGAEGPNARTLRASFERACFEPLQGKPGFPLGMTTQEEPIALALMTVVPELPCSIDDEPIDARVTLEAAFLGLASL